MELAKCDAAILVGGESRRMGTPKALLELAGKPLLQHVADAVIPWFARVIAVGTLPQNTLLDKLGMVQAPDVLPGRSSLNGVLSALHGSHTQWTAIFACDAPWPCMPLLHQMASLAGQNIDAVICCDTAGQLQPFHALWNRTAVSALSVAAENDLLKLQHVLSRLRTCIIPPELWLHHDLARRFLHNINSPEDLASNAQS